VLHSFVDIIIVGVRFFLVIRTVRLVRDGWRHDGRARCGCHDPTKVDLERRAPAAIVAVQIADDETDHGPRQPAAVPEFIFAQRQQFLKAC